MRGVVLHLRILLLGVLLLRILLLDLLSQARLHISVLDHPLFLARCLLVRQGLELRLLIPDSDTDSVSKTTIRRGEC